MSRKLASTQPSCWNGKVCLLCNIYITISLKQPLQRCGIEPDYGWKIEWLEFESRWSKEFLFFPLLYTGSETQRTYYLMYTGEFFQGSSGRRVKLTALLQVMPRSRRHESMNPLLLLPHGAVLSQLRTGIIVPFMFLHRLLEQHNVKQANLTETSAAFRLKSGAETYPTHCCLQLLLLVGITF